MAEAIARVLNAPALKEGTVLRVGLEVRGDAAKIVRTSVYDRTTHLSPSRSTIAAAMFLRRSRNQSGTADRVRRFAAAGRCAAICRPSMTASTAPPIPTACRRSDPSVDQAAGLRRRFPVAAQPFGPARGAVFAAGRRRSDASDGSELLYISSTLRRPDPQFLPVPDAGRHGDYFDEDGRSAEQFLLRNPLPDGKFRSGFGARRHPILGYVRMHTGVDWAAPIGTPIIAAGNGVVEKAGWAGGYGQQTIIRHANGYETSYNHQSAFAKGIEPGVHVRQGQTIGYLGQTGLATGPHLHYELIVNGTKVDPMRVRLPVGKVLRGDDLSPSSASASASMTCLSRTPRTG